MVELWSDGTKTQRSITPIQLPVSFLGGKKIDSYHREDQVGRPGSEPGGQAAAMAEGNAKRDQNPVAESDNHRDAEAKSHASADMFFEREGNGQSTMSGEIKGKASLIWRSTS